MKLGLALNVGARDALTARPDVPRRPRRMLGRAGGLVAGGVFAILPAPIFFTGLFLSETTFIFMLVGFLALAGFLPDRRWTPVGARASPPVWPR